MSGDGKDDRPKFNFPPPPPRPEASTLSQPKPTDIVHPVPESVAQTPPGERRPERRPSITGFGWGLTMTDAGKKDGATPLAEVGYTFHRVDDPAAEWKVLRFHMSEGISELYKLTLDLVSTREEPASLLDQSVTFMIQRGSIQRKLHGIVFEYDDLGVIASNSRHTL